jgi:sulfur-carrier protein
VANNILKKEVANMSIKVRIPTPLRSLTNGSEEVTVEGKSIKEVIDNLEASCNGIKKRLCDENGQIRRFINFYVNDEDIRFLNNQETEVKDGDQISIVPAIAGGTIARQL